MTRITTKSCNFNIEYLQGRRESIKLTKKYVFRKSIELVIKFIDGRHSDTAWRYFTKERGLPMMINDDFNELMDPSSETVELSTVFVAHGVVDAKLSWKETEDSLETDKDIIQETPQEPNFDIVFVLRREDDVEPVVVVFQPVNDSPTPGSAAATPRQNEYLQQQTEQNKNEIASLKETLRQQGGSDLQRQVNQIEIRTEQKLKQYSDVSSKLVEDASDAARKELAKFTEIYNQKLDQLQREHLRQAASLVDENRELKNRLDTIGKYVRPIPAIQDGIATMSSNSTCNGHSPQNCYLYGMYIGVARCWAAGTADKNNKKQYLKASFPKEYAVTGIAIAPRGEGAAQYVTKFKVQTTTDESEESDQCKWECIKTRDGSEEFESGITSHSQRPVHINFQRPVMARAIRFMVTDWHSHPSMRCEVYVLEKELMGALQ